MLLPLSLVVSINEIISLLGAHNPEGSMDSPISGSLVSSEYYDEVFSAALFLRNIWAYPCKLPSCPDYGKSWLLRSILLLHLQEQNAHETTATTVAERRIMEDEWRYITDPNLPPLAAPNFRFREDTDEHVWEYGFRDDTGKVIRGQGTMKQIGEHMASRR